MLTKLTFTK